MELCTPSRETWPPLRGSEGDKPEPGAVMSAGLSAFPIFCAFKKQRVNGSIHYYINDS
jgi:hypothetical protein